MAVRPAVFDDAYALVHEFAASPGLVVARIPRPARPEPARPDRRPTAAHVPVEQRLDRGGVGRLPVVL